MDLLVTFVMLASVISNFSVAVTTTLVNLLITIMLGVFVVTGLSIFALVTLVSRQARKLTPQRRLAEPSKVISQIDIHRAANLLIEHHGAQAVIEAGRLADLMLERGDREGTGRQRIEQQKVRALIPGSERSVT